MSSKSTHILLQRVFAKKKKDFKGFSLRWAASQLGISHVYLSHMLKGNRPIAVSIVEPLCEILDLDAEARDKIFRDAFTAKGYKPLAPKDKALLQTEREWHLSPKKDLDLLSRWEIIAIMQTTLLKKFDGSPEFIAGRLFIPVHTVRSILDLLTERGYLEKINGKMRASKAFYEFQSRSSKDQIRAYHKSVMLKASAVLEKTDQDSVEERLITSAALTCSKEDVARLKNKIAEFLKEFVQESAAAEPDSVYQLGLQFFPVVRAES